MVPPPNPAAERINEVTAAYYRQIEQFSPLERDLIDWFVQLSPEDKTAAAGLPYETWPALDGFRRYYLEKRGCSMLAYMETHLTRPERAEWVDEAAGRTVKRNP